MSQPLPFSCTGYSNFEELYRQEYPSFFRLIFSKVKDRELAEDLTQVTFIKVSQHMNTYLPREGKDLKENFKSWITTIAMNNISNHFRRSKIEERYQFHDENNGGEYNFSDPAELVQDKQGLDRTIAAIKSIRNPGIREAARLWYVENKTYAEISAELGTPVGTVMSRLHRSKRELRDYLEEFSSD